MGKIREYTCLCCNQPFSSNKGCKTRQPRFCGRKCAAAYNLSRQEVLDKMSIAKKAKEPWNKGVQMWKGKEHPRGTLGKKFAGKKASDETRAKLSAYWKGRKRPFATAEKHGNWKGGVTAPNRAARKSMEYDQWRFAVYARDNKTCTKCGYHGKFIHAHHIKPFAEFPELRYDVSNGETLCIDCHSIEHGKDFHIKCASLCLDCQKKIKRGAKRCIPCQKEYTATKNKCVDCGCTKTKHNRAPRCRSCANKHRQGHLSMHPKFTLQRQQPIPTNPTP